MRRLAACVVLALMTTPAVARAQVLTGLALFEQHCGSCHSQSGGTGRAPDRIALSQRTPESILEAITTGSMRVNAQALTDAQKRIIAEQVALRPLGSSASGAASAMKNACTADAPVQAGGRWSGWGVDTGNSRFQPNGGGHAEPEVAVRAGRRGRPGHR